MIGVVADDTTGANDIGIMFTKSGYKVKVVIFEPDLQVTKDTDVLIIDTDSRLDSPSLSYEKVKKATAILKKLNCSMYHNKTCSVFRGNIGVEFDAMLDELGEDLAIITLAFPKNGRTTSQGVHKVFGKNLEGSEFAKDPVQPMLESNLQSILQKQTKRKVTSIYLDIVRKGPESLRDAIEIARKNFNYVIVDAQTQEDIYTIAEATVGYKVLAGSSAIGEELPKVLAKSKYQNLANTIDITDKNGVLVISGSLTPQTKGQTQALIESGFPFITVDSRIIVNEAENEEAISKVVRKAKYFLVEGKNLLIMAENNPDIVKETKEIGLLKGLNELEISKKVSDFLAEAAKRITDDLNLKRIVVAGGDTSGTVCRKLGIKGNYIISEIDTGVPSGLAIGREMLIVLKSGSFGKRDFLFKAVEHLKQLPK